VTVADPYRYLEDPEAEETKQWVAAQNTLSSSVLGECPKVDAFKTRLGTLYDYERFSCPFRRGEGQLKFFHHNTGTCFVM
jgi:prolyl oligopeptidase